MEDLMVISSDGHATARMRDYRDYLEQRFLPEFDAFLIEWEDHGSRNIDLPALKIRLDPEFVEEWSEKMLNTNRLDGDWDPLRRIEEMEREGVVGEVLFPDFGLPFDLYSVGLAASLGRPPKSVEHTQAANRAYNRWLVDFVHVAPERFAGMAAVSWDDVDAAVQEIRWAHQSGLKGIVLPAFDAALPLYHEQFEPIWSELEALGMVANSHVAMSSTSNQPIYNVAVPHPACRGRLFTPECAFLCHNILSHLIWGGVLERHPRLKVVFTEQGSGWVVPLLLDMDHSYVGSFLRSDIKSVIRSKPSEYFARQCYLGSSVFSKAEVEGRHRIGLDKMMLGIDYPHHEGTFLQSTQNYLRATLGAAGVPVKEARMILGQTAAEVFDFDVDKLASAVARVAMKPKDILAPPEEDLYPRGDVHKPEAFVN